MLMQEKLFLHYRITTETPVKITVTTKLSEVSMKILKDYLQSSEVFQGGRS